MLGCRNIDSLMDVNTKLLLDQEELLKNVGRYMRLVEKLNYLTVTKSDITFAGSVDSQFLSASRTAHLEAVMRILRRERASHKYIRVAGFLDAD